LLSVSIIVALVLSSLVGVSLGLLGGGGSILCVPLLVYIAGIPAKVSIPMSLVIVGSTSLWAAWMHRRKRNVHLVAAAIMGIGGMVGSYFGAMLTQMFSDHWLLLMFAIIMIIVGGLMIFQSRRGGDEGPKTHLNIPATFVAGVSVGVLTGFLGIGGGFLLVPALIWVAKLPIRLAVGTSLLVISLNAFSGFLSHIRTVSIPLLLTASFTGASFIGAIVGQYLAHRSTPANLRKAFGGFVFVIGVIVAALNVGKVL